jgi:predicted ATP-dependent serine protease
MAIATVHSIASRDPHLAPEALFISALIDTGSYLPEKYQVQDNYFSAHRPVHEFCKKYQADAKKSPDIGIVRKKFSTFPYMQEIDPVWAARELKEAWQKRVYLSAMSAASVALSHEEFDVKEAHGHLKEAVETANPTASRFATGTDFHLFENPKELIRIPVDLDTTDRLNSVTGGGIAPGHLWLMAARLGIGKTWRLTQMAIAAAEAGWDVWFYSTEMLADEILDRLHRIALRNTWKRPWNQITPKERVELFEAWQANAGRLNVIDPEMVGTMSAMTVAGNTTQDSVALVDYIGNFHTESGQAASDYVTMTQVSKELKQAALRHRIPIIAAAQINREGGKSDNPGAHHLSQGDIGKDADVIVTMTEVSARVRINSMTKNRHGRQGFKWFTMFDPDTGQFHDLDPQRASAIREADEDLANSAIT